jgi:hypothetical protein
MRIGTAGCADDRADLVVFEHRVQVCELSLAPRWLFDALAEPNLEAVAFEFRRPRAKRRGTLAAMSDAGATTASPGLRAGGRITRDGCQPPDRPFVRSVGDDGPTAS